MHEIRLYQSCFYIQFFVIVCKILDCSRGKLMGFLPLILVILCVFRMKLLSYICRIQEQILTLHFRFYIIYKLAFWLLSFTGIATVFYIKKFNIREGVILYYCYFSCLFCLFTWLHYKFLLVCLDKTLSNIVSLFFLTIIRPLTRFHSVTESIQILIQIAPILS